MQRPEHPPRQGGSQYATENPLAKQPDPRGVRCLPEIWSETLTPQVEDLHSKANRRINAKNSRPHSRPRVAVWILVNYLFPSLFPPDLPRSPCPLSPAARPLLRALPLALLLTGQSQSQATPPPPPGLQWVPCLSLLLGTRIPESHRILTACINFLKTNRGTAKATSGFGADRDLSTVPRALCCRARKQVQWRQLMPAASTTVSYRTSRARRQARSHHAANRGRYRARTTRRRGLPQVCYARREAVVRRSRIQMEMCQRGVSTAVMCGLVPRCLRATASELLHPNPPRQYYRSLYAFGSGKEKHRETLPLKHLHIETQFFQETNA